MESSLTEEKINEICTHLEETAEMMEAPLTCSPEAIESLEDILHFLKESGDEGALSGAEFMCGVYMGEIIRKQTNAKWVYSEEYQEHTLNIDELLIYPIAKIRKFVTQPDSEGLELYVRVILAKAKS